jgi:hydroxymethylpyrimidine/phosphomethylpyrimidine kinase
VKGGHLAGAKRAVDVLFDGRQTHNLVGPLVPGVRTHGTGCAFSAAIAANLALGCGLVESVANAKGFVSAAIRSAKTIRGHCVLNL